MYSYECFSSYFCARNKCIRLLSFLPFCPSPSTIHYFLPFPLILFHVSSIFHCLVFHLYMTDFKLFHLNNHWTQVDRRKRKFEQHFLSTYVNNDSEWIHKRMNLWTCRWRWNFFLQLTWFFFSLSASISTIFYSSSCDSLYREKLEIELNRIPFFFLIIKIIQRFKNFFTICALSVLQVTSWKEQDKV